MSGPLFYACLRLLAPPHCKGHTQPPSLYLSLRQEGKIHQRLLICWLCCCCIITCVCTAAIPRKTIYICANECVRAHSCDFYFNFLGWLVFKPELKALLHRNFIQNDLHKLHLTSSRTFWTSSLISFFFFNWHKLRKFVPIRYFSFTHNV